MSDHDHGQAHPRAALRHDLAECRSDAQDQRQLADEILADRLATALAVHTEEIRGLRETVDRLVALVNAVAERL